MQMHEWERQEALLDNIEATNIDDCLKYDVFTYEKHEWDNIPAIVPRYIIYLAKYMQGVVGISHDLYNREDVRDLRADLCGQIGASNALINGNRETDLQEKKALRDDLGSTDKTVADFRNTYDSFALEATKLNEAECSLQFDSCMKVVMQTRGRDGGPAGDDERAKKRMFSFKQLFNLINTCSNSSELSDRVEKAEQDVAELFSNVEELRNSDKKLRGHTDSVRAELYRAMEENTTTQGETNAKFQEQFDEA